MNEQFKVITKSIRGKSVLETIDVLDEFYSTLDTEKKSFLRFLKLDFMVEISVKMQTESNSNSGKQNTLSIYWNSKRQEMLKALKEWIDKEENLLSTPIISSEESKSIIPEIDLNTQKEQIRLLYDLGIIDFLVNKYPSTLKNNNNQVSKLISKFLKIPETSTQPTINALLNDNSTSDKYPKETSNTKTIIATLNANESR